MYVMSGAVGVADRAIGLQGDLDIGALKRLGGELLGREGIDEAIEPALTLHELIVVEHHTPVPQTGKREDARAKHFATSVFEQSRIDVSANQVLVDPQGLARVHRLRMDGFSIDVEREVADGGAVGHREEVLAFDRARVGVAEDLIDADASNLIADFDVDMVITHGELNRRGEIGPRADDDEAVGKNGRCREEQSRDSERGHEEDPG